ncbi:polysaccharide pyruvyl transferase family protein [Candidatus Gracilibacteria bacterium]|nr:polysaccharide pyruvyl transferase family protein [Candidatus Gracilibacteria bacterium]
MKITIFASIGAQNLGDELILKNEIDELRAEYGDDTRFVVMSYDTAHLFFQDASVKYSEYFPIDSKKPKNLIRNIGNFFSTLWHVATSDIAVIGGGGIFYDTEIQKGESPLRQWLMRVRMCQLLRTPILFYAVGIDIQKKYNLPKIKAIFKSSDHILVRDQHSADTLKQVGIKSEIIPDPVFSDNQKKHPTGKCLKTLSSESFDATQIADIDFKGKTVGLALRRGYIKKEEKQITEMIHIIEKAGGKVFLLPHSFHKMDVLANDLIFLSQFYKKKHEFTTHLSGAYEAYSQNKIDMCISMRYHSMVLSRIYGIDYVAINYAEKTRQLHK